VSKSEADPEYRLGRAPTSGRRCAWPSFTSSYTGAADLWCWQWSEAEISTARISKVEDGPMKPDARCASRPVSWGLAEMKTPAAPIRLVSIRNAGAKKQSRVAKSPKRLRGRDRDFASYIRESSDNPILSAFCRVAPSVRFSVLAIFLACVFLRASDFSSRTSAVVQVRLFDVLFKV